MKRRHLLVASAAALACPALAQPQIGSVLRFVPETDLPTPDPHLSASRATRDHAFMVFDTLFGRDTANKPQPQMVDFFAVEQGGLAWRLRLRNGLFFHTYERVRPADCIASLRRWAARDPGGQALLAATADMTGPDDRTILIRLKTPFPMLREVLSRTSGPVCAMLPARLAATSPDVPIAEVIGSGPFRYEAAEREPGKRVVYLRHEPYIPTRERGSRTAGAKDVIIERVEWQVMNDADAAAALVTGTVDWWGTVAPAELAALRRSPDVALPVIAPGGLIVTLRPNHLTPPFDNAAIRRALFAAISQRDCMQALNGADGPAWRDDIGFFSPAARIPGGPPPTQPPEAAKQALAAAGYKGEGVRLLVPAGRYAPLGAAIAGRLRELGMTVAVLSLTPEAMAPALARTDGFTAGGWNLALGDAEPEAQEDPMAHVLLRGNGRDAAPGWPTSPRLETMRDAWIAAPDAAWQARIAAQMQAQAMQDVPYIPLGLTIPPSAHRTAITGLPGGQPLFWGVNRKV